MREKIKKIREREEIRKIVVLKSFIDVKINFDKFFKIVKKIDSLDNFNLIWYENLIGRR